MRSISAAVVCIVGLAAPPLAAQGGFVLPQPPCNIKAGFYLVTSAIVYFNLAGNPKYLDQREKNLREAHRVLLEAQGKGQAQNPAAWYYLGRYYVEVGDAAGGDSAFRKAEALAPECADDIHRYRQGLWLDVMNNGFRTWQEGKEDSAITFFRSARSLNPSNPKSAFQLGFLYAARDATDSAMVYLRQGAELAEKDTAFARDRRNALSTIARLHLRPVQADPAVQQWQRTRASRDSVERAITGDSTVMARVLASAASRRARGATLAPADQRLFSRDSGARAQALVQGRGGRVPLAAKAMSDSAAAQRALGPAISAFRGYLAAYPSAGDAVTSLVFLYGQSGRTVEATAFFDSLFARARDLDADLLFETGQRLVNEKDLLAVGARALTLGLAKNPYHRNALFELARAYLTLHDSTNTLPTAQRLAAIDPLNRSSLRLLAAGWDLRGRRDSMQKYRALADSTLPVEIVVTGVAGDSTGFTLTVLAVNVRPSASTPFRLTFEFLDPQGAVKASQTADIPAIPPGRSHQVDFRVTGQGSLAWRYRSS